MSPVTMIANDPNVTTDLRDVLLADSRLVRLLGGKHVFIDVESDPPAPHINIAQSKPDAFDPRGDRLLSLQIWPHSGERKVAEALIARTERALEKAGVTGDGTSARLQKLFGGARRLPDSREFHCILRYREMGYPAVS